MENLRNKEKKGEIETRGKEEKKGGRNKHLIIFFLMRNSPFKCLDSDGSDGVWGVLDTLNL